MDQPNRDTKYTQWSPLDHRGQRMRRTVHNCTSYLIRLTRDDEKASRLRAPGVRIHPQIPLALPRSTGHSNCI
eukprot:COSAG02_NODE_2150_length_9660_cov_45.377889_7_plen_73_part_00